jgi:tetratricopeptide (TPR) repeat protein
VSTEIAAQRASTPVRVKKALAGDLAAIALHALAKRPADRYRSSESFCADLDRWLEGRPIEATAPTAWVRAVRFVGRHRAATALASTAILAIMVAAGTAVYQGILAQEQATRALAAREFAFDLFRAADPNAAKDGPMSVRALLASGARRSGERFAADPALRAEILQQIGQVQARLGEKTDAQATLAVAVELLRQQGDSRRWAEVQIELADLHGRLGTTATAYRLLQEIEPVVERAESSHGLSSRFHEVKGWLYRDEQRLEEARSEMEQALTQARLVTDDHGQRVIDVLRGLASVESAQNDSSAAIAHIDEAAEWIGRSPEALLNDVIGIGLEQARIRFAAGDYKVAGDLVSSYAPRCRQALGERSETCLLLLDQQVQVLLGVGDTAAAFALVPALQTAQEALSSPVRKARFLVIAGRAQAAGGPTGVDDGVFPPLRQLAESPRELSLPAISKLSANLVLAEAALRRGDVDAALRWLDGFAQRQSSWKVSIDTLRVRATVLRGIALAIRGDAGESANAFRSAADDASAAFGPSHTLCLIYRLNLLASPTALGQTEQRNELIDSVLPSLQTRLGVSSPLVQRAQAMRESRPPAASGHTPAKFSDFFL